VCPTGQESQGITAKKSLSNFTTATNDEKRQEQHRIRQFFSSLLGKYSQEFLDFAAAVRSRMSLAQFKKLYAW
jgi:hypothetical protein